MFVPPRLRVFFVSILCIGLLQACANQPDTEVASTASDARVSLAGQWQFQIDPYKRASDEQWWQEQTDTSNWDKIAVPGVWDTYDRYSDYMGDAWYRTEFIADKSWHAQQVRLVFDSVYHDAEVWLNGQYLGENKLGFMAFDFDVSNHLRLGSNNTLIVKANNRFRRGAVWNWGGIRRPVYLDIRPQTHISKVYVNAQPNLATGSAKINLKAFLANLSEKPVSVTADFSVMRDGELVAHYPGEKALTIAAGESAELEKQQVLAAEKVALWHFNHPNLYHIKTTLRIDGEAVHQHKDRFGIRKVEVKDRKFYLNGEQVRLVGLNMVPEDRFDGNALPLSRIKEDVDLLKTLNANFARLSGPALPKEYLDYLDEVGFLVVEEVALWGKDSLVDPDHPLPKEWLERLVSDNYNHPSVVARSVGNEIGDLTKNPKVMEYVEGAIKHAKELDPSRLAVYISYSADYQKDDPSRFSDIVMFNKYNDHEERLKVVDSYYPEKPIFFSEIGTRLDGVDPNESVLDVEALMGPLRNYPYLIGTSHFAFNDYRSTWYDEKPSWTTDFSQNRAWGVLTSYRNKKRSFTKLQKFYSPLEVFDLDSRSGQTLIHIRSRSLDSFPAYTMQGYRVVWQAFNDQGESQAIGQFSLPSLKPGDTAPSYTLPYSGDYATLKVSLLAPKGYVAHEIRHDKRIAPAARISSTHVSIDTIRVHFERSPLAREYQLIATAADGKVIEGKATINSFAEVSGLEPQAEYDLQLIAINDAGKSQFSDTPVKVSTAPNELPPIIWATEGKRDAFHIGFSVDKQDFGFEIQYGLEPGEYSHKHIIQTRGATRVPAIKAGATHYFQLRRLITGTIDSDWSPSHKVVLQGLDGLLPPENTLALTTETGLLIQLTPVRSATGYRIEATSQDGETLTMDSSLAYSPYITVDGAQWKNVNDLRIATLNEQGQLGEFSSVQSVTGSK
ncbi:beta galactosidase jelly roll domain-containing protein [Gilvimarinus agarilyticus]|uniref:sugar-binding domain-containing protein n=1 Tax=Gilvimarinus sp. 2_MG-2023 TaxID=3062666 RepID=UPI001C086E6A|nr:sugar-binding domain-containing protein [Gilvimarinus sp. 2_MG-2023]MBU2887744.1 beta galactosidase jelly roll domain-containing protein [Gilvimarinus agarilyticus]MDO6572392.1 glycoside hydrolase family 2 TIM barrel-domain containing protein [Gilvimarinus sp. 2_MG-2023]